MVNINFDTKSFPTHYGLSDSTHTLNCTWADILLAAITVGRKNWKWVLKYGQESEHEMAFRIHMLLSFLQENSKGEIERTESFKTLDPSEKVAISYFLGLIGTKLIAEKQFGIPWIMHLDVYTKFAMGPDKVTIDKWKDDSNVRPDLIGLNKSKNWVVIEAKGRSNNLGLTKLSEAKDQTKNIKKINGQYPYLRFANSTFFKKDVWTFSLIDPEEYYKDAPSLEISYGQFLRDYYFNIFNILKTNSTYSFVHNDSLFVVTELSGTNLFLGMLYDIYYRLLEIELTDDKMFEELIMNSLKNNEDNWIDSNQIRNSSHSFDEDYDIAVGNDGIIVIYQPNKKNRG